MTDLQTFLSDMALHPEKFAEFLRGPEAAINRARLSAEDKAALLSGIPAMIAARLAAYLAYPPPYYAPTQLLGTHPTFVTIAPYTSPTFVTKAPALYVTAPPPLYVKPGHPVFVTMPPLVVPARPGEDVAPAPAKAPKKSR